MRVAAHAGSFISIIPSAPLECTARDQDHLPLVPIEGVKVDVQATMGLQMAWCRSAVVITGNSQTKYFCDHEVPSKRLACSA
jgi:hypothetical protein